MALVVLLLLVLAITLAVMLHQQSLIRGRTRLLEGRLARLEWLLEAGADPKDPSVEAPDPPADRLLEQPPDPSPAPPLALPTPARASAPPPPLVRRHAPQAQAPGSPGRPTAPRGGTTLVAPDPAGPVPWSRRVERQFIENWTGILGVVVVVAGATFVAIHLALRFDPLQRFLVTVAAAAALAAPSLLLRHRPSWQRLTTWMRSGGGALFLLACAGAGGLPGLGLQWLSDPRSALALLSLGVVVNLVLAGVSRRQSIASLHVVLTLVPLVIVAQNSLTLAIASLVAASGLVFPLRQRWDGHRLIVAAAYGLFQACWFLRSADPLQASGDLRIQGALAAVLVFGGGALLAHHRALSSPPGAGRSPIALPLLLQLIQWGALGLALLLYPPDPLVRAGALAVAAAVAALLARQARGVGRLWLRRSDTLIAQSLAMTVILGLQPRFSSGLVLLAALLVETVLFLRIGIAEDDPLIRRVGWVLVQITGLALVLAGLVAALTTSEPWAQGQNCALLIGAGALIVLVQVQGRAVPFALPWLPAWLGAALVVVGAVFTPPALWREPLALVAVGGLLLLARRQRPPGLLAASSGAVLVSHGGSWIWMLLHQPHTPLALLGHLLPLLLLALAQVAAAEGSAAGPLGIDLFGVSAALGAHLLFAPLSPLIPGVAWLILSLVALGASNRLRPTYATHALVMGLLLLVAFAGNYLLVIHHSPVLVGPWRARLLIELFGLAVVLVWWFFRPGESLAANRLWQAVHPWFLEASLLGVVVTIFSEVAPLARPLAWSLFALALLAEPLERLFAPRLKVYSVIVYWVSLGAAVAMLGRLESPSPLGWDQPQALALGAIAVQVATIVVARQALVGGALLSPGGTGLLRWIGARVAAHPNRWLCYPLFLSVALYLATRYDHALLTLLWAVQAFVIYVLSAVLRDNQFRYLALLGLGGCLLRLVAIDMGEADLGLRGVVFIGVGVLMLAMNALYNRFRGRFE